MNCASAEVRAAKTAIRRQHGCDSYYVGSHATPQVKESPTVHEFVLDDAGSTAYVWFVSSEPRVVLKDIGESFDPLPCHVPR